MNTIGPMRGIHEVMALRHEVLSKSRALQEVRATADSPEAKGARPAAGPGARRAPLMWTALAERL